MICCSQEVYKPLSHCKHSQFNSLTIETQLLTAQRNLKTANQNYDLLLSGCLQTLVTLQTHSVQPPRHWFIGDKIVESTAQP